MAQLSQIQRQRRQFRLFSWVGAALVGGSLIALNLIVSYVPLRLDTSTGNIYSISKGTKQILNRLEDTLLIRMVFSDDLPAAYKLNEQYVNDLLAEYRRASKGLIRIEHIAPGESQKSRQEAAESGVIPVQLNVQRSDRLQVMESFMGISFLYGDRKEAIPFVRDTENLEYEITRRIKKLIDPEKLVVGLVSSGGAQTLTSESLQMLQEPLNELYDIRFIDLKTGVPDGTRALWMIGPTQPVEPAALEAIKTYVAKGGTFGLLLDRRSVEVKSFMSRPLETGMEPLLSAWGLNIGNGYAADPQCDRIQVRAVQGAYRMINIVDYVYFPWITTIDRQHPATRDVDGFTLPFAAPIEIQKEIPGLTYRPLARTTPASWLDANPMFLSPIENREKPEGAQSGPFTLGLLIEGKFSSDPSAKPGRVVVFGTSKFIDAAYPPRPSNYTLFVNLMDWSAQDEILLGIRSKGAPRRPIKRMPAAARNVVKYLMVVTLPLVCLVVGVIVWRTQRNRRALLPLRYRETM